jgi:hypothetical protein
VRTPRPDADAPPIQPIATRRRVWNACLDRFPDGCCRRRYRRLRGCERPGRELVPNGEFSLACPGASCGWSETSASAISQDSSTFVSAPASLKLAYTGPNQFGGADTVSNSCIAVTPGTAYTLSYSYRFSAATGHVEFVGAGAQFKEAANCSDAPIVASFVGGNGTTTGDDQWHQIGGLVTAPPNAHSVNVTLDIACDSFPCAEGAFARFDDVSLELSTVTTASRRVIGAHGEREAARRPSRSAEL